MKDLPSIKWDELLVIKIITNYPVTPDKKQVLYHAKKYYNMGLGVAYKRCLRKKWIRVSEDNKIYLNKAGREQITAAKRIVT